jgi:hypothetical protein
VKKKIEKKKTNNAITCMQHPCPHKFFKNNVKKH